MRTAGGNTALAADAAGFVRENLLVVVHVRAVNNHAGDDVILLDCLAVQVVNEVLDGGLDHGRAVSNGHKAAELAVGSKRIGIRRAAEHTELAFSFAAEGKRFVHAERNILVFKAAEAERKRIIRI